MKNFFLITILSCVIQSCTNEAIDNSDPASPWGVVSKNFVRAYIYPDSILTNYYVESIDSFSTGKINSPMQTITLLLAFPSDEDSVLRQRLYSGEEWYSESKLGQFNALAIANKDTNFNRDGAFGGCLADAIEEINIISDKEWDESHPANTSLNDLIDIHFQSAKEFIESGYSDSRFDPKVNGKNVFMIESLQQFNAEKRNLLAPSFKFIFRKQPQPGSIHNIKIFYSDSAGRDLVIPINAVAIKK